MIWSSRRSDWGTEGGCVHRRLRHDNGRVTGFTFHWKGGLPGHHYFTSHHKCPTRQSVTIHRFSQDHNRSTSPCAAPTGSMSPVGTLREGTEPATGWATGSNLLCGVSHTARTTRATALKSRRKPCEAHGEQRKSRSGGIRAFFGFGRQLDCHRDLWVCLALEIDSLYVDIAIRRWEAFVGDKAILEGAGKTFEEIARERRDG
uniref:Uncharacterized protein n=1 Tax=Candidatus Kentrum sp. MB TaxID=2138164 RepID=A0A450WZR6_9GAMM|nr:MAG: hypothetical protein BECKMB1821G_GA0114241_100240 [Candidatus Kentron sp. MB]VFK28822.1 MAG: hypothetical protein BECKMB1821I_GA0114274_100741 [Candidatus Kentron sp. MB]VFK74110.1 MAG: hypothetical protein BECKMB1821H_GA0114242_100141 [Candidatus Kentron sp. MB]